MLLYIGISFMTITLDEMLCYISDMMIQWAEKRMAAPRMRCDEDYVFLCLLKLPLPSLHFLSSAIVRR